MKYLAHFCDCGKIIFFDNHKINESREKDERVLLICSDCNRKYNIYFLEEEKYFISGAIVYQEIDYSKYDRIFYGAEEKNVYMKTGGQATECFKGYFLDLNRDVEFPLSVRSKIDVERTLQGINNEEQMNAIKKALTIKNSNLKYIIINN